MRTIRLLAFASALSASLLVPHGAGQSSFTTLYTFDAPANGQGPTGVAGSNGALYGTTQFGGAYSAGTVFQLKPPTGPGGAWTETLLHSFPNQNGVDGTTPLASLVVGPGGNLYGTTAGGGAFDQGTVFELRPPVTPGGAWAEAVLYSFSGQDGDGAEPSAGLVMGQDGAIYGTTFYGGLYGWGAVFELQPAGTGGSPPGSTWTEAVLYSFTGGGDGAWAEGLAMSAEGVLYGTTFLGGALGAGTVFELLPPATPGGVWTETVLHSFMGGADGVYPVAPPVIAGGGSLYGSTTGTAEIDGYPGTFGLSTVFELAPPSAPGGSWNKTLLAAVGDGDDGVGSTLIVRDGAVYGATGDKVGGEVFELQKPASPGGSWTMILLHRFTDGSTPIGRLVMDKNGAIYGATVKQFNHRLAGTVYRIEP